MTIITLARVHPRQLAGMPWSTRRALLERRHAEVLAAALEHYARYHALELDDPRVVELVSESLYQRRRKAPAC